MNTNDFTRTEIDSWKTDPITQTFRRELEKRIRVLTERFLYGATISEDSMETTAIRTMGLYGRIKGLEEALDIYHTPAFPADEGGE